MLLVQRHLATVPDNSTPLCSSPHFGGTRLNSANLIQTWMIRSQRHQQNKQIEFCWAISVDSHSDFGVGCAPRRKHFPRHLPSFTSEFQPGGSQTSASSLLRPRLRESAAPTQKRKERPRPNDSTMASFMEGSGAVRKWSACTAQSRSEQPLGRRRNAGPTKLGASSASAAAARMRQQRIHTVEGGGKNAIRATGSNSRRIFAQIRGVRGACDARAPTRATAIEQKQEMVKYSFKEPRRSDRLAHA